jgi:uncharacterized integral membrane protein
MSKTKTIVGAVVTFVVMLVCGCAAGFAAALFVIKLAYASDVHSNLEAAIWSFPGIVIELGSAVIGFLAPGAIAWYLYKRG